MKAKVILSGLTIGNAIIDLGNNAYNFSKAVSKQEHIGIKDVISTDISASLLDFTVIAMEFCPIPQVKVAGVILNGIFSAMDLDAMLKDRASNIESDLEFEHNVKVPVDIGINFADGLSFIPGTPMSKIQTILVGGLVVDNLSISEYLLEDFLKEYGIIDKDGNYNGALGGDGSSGNGGVVYGKKWEVVKIAEILQDIKEFPFYTLNESIMIIMVFLIFSYIIRPRCSVENWYKHWKFLATIFIMIWIICSSNAMGRQLVRQENFTSLVKFDGILKYDNDEGFYLIVPSAFNREYHFRIGVRLLNHDKGVSHYENQFVTIWQKNHIAYQLEHNGNVIYSLERSNSKVWLGIIWDLIRYYIRPFCYMLFYYLIIINWVNEERS